MTKINDHSEKCFADVGWCCAALSEKCKKRTKDKCPFYKPADCKDWIKVVRDGEEWIMPPEEYFGEDYYG